MDAITGSKSPAIYTRVSTDKQESGLESQLRALEEHCIGSGIKNYSVYSDENISGAKSSRPGLDRMLEAVRSGLHDCVIVYSFSRFARSTKHLLEALDEFGRLNVSFISITESVDTRTPIGKAFFTIISAISQLERELVVERVRNGIKNARAKGKRIGRPRKRPSALIRQLASDGHTYREIARLANTSHGAIADELREARCSESKDSEQNVADG